VKDFFKKNLGLKLASVAIALSLEIYFMSPQNLVTETISATVDLQGLAADRVIVWPPAAEEGLLVDCKIRGPGPIVQEIKDNPRKFTITFPPKPSTTYIASLNPSDLRLPSGVELLEVKPPRFEFRIEELIKKEIKISVSKTGQLKPGLKLEEIKPTIETVLVSGPKGELTSLDSIETEDIDLTQYKESIDLDVALRPISSRVSFDKRTVRVAIRISPREVKTVVIE
jgi:hypothetical protein